MATDEGSKSASNNSCCALWKEKYSKVLASRNALREAVKILQQQIDVKEAENVNLKKACEDEQNRVHMEKEEKRKLSSALLTLENEVTRLKSEINLLQQSSCVEDVDKDVKVFQDEISKHKKDSDRLNLLLDIEKRKADEKTKEWKCKLTLLEKDANGAKAKLVSETRKFQETIKKLEAEKQKLIKEKRNTESEIKNLQEQKKVAESYKKNSDSFSQKLLENVKSIEQANRQLEIEKQKVIREIKRADEQKKLAEDNWKKAMEERHNAEQLSQQLHKERLMIDDLKKKINEISSSRGLFNGSDIPMNKDDKAESTKVKFLKKQLKFEKLQFKHAKEETKLEASRNGILKQELGRLKLDFSQYVNRLNMLDISFSTSGGIIDDLEKPKHNANMRRSSQKRSLCCLREDENDGGKLEEEILHAYRSTADVCDPKMKTTQLTPLNLNTSGGNSSCLFSGMESKLKPPVGGSYRKMDSSAINSTTESFSDGQLMGSQERCALSVNASEKLAENFIHGTTISDRSGEVTKVRCGDGPPFSAYTCRRPLTQKGDKIVDKKDRKRKRTCDVVEYIESLYSEHKKLNLLIENQFTSLSCLLERKTDNNSTGEAHAVKNRKKKKRSQKLKAEKENRCDDNNTAVARDEARVIDDKNLCGRIVQPCLIETGSPLQGTQGLHGSTRSLEPTFDFIVNADGNYMKLLDLDDDADEELYRTARDKLLSPLLHTIKSNVVDTVAHKLLPSSDETLHVELCTDREDLLSDSSYSDIAAELNPKIPKFNTLKPSDDLLHYNMQGYEIDGNNGHISNSQVHKSAVVTSSNALNSADEGVTPSLDNEIKNLQDSFQRCYVTFPVMKDCSNISGIFASARNCIARCKLDSQIGWVAGTIFLALIIEENLLSKERACVLLSLLLLNFSIVSVTKFGELSDGNAVSRADSYAEHISSEAGMLFREYDLLDELLCIIEEFLICGKVMNINYATLTKLDLSQNGAFMPPSSEIASNEQLVACSIVFTSICAAINRIEFIYEASYNVIRMSGWESSVASTILHVCAHLCREKLLISSNHSIVIAVLRSVVMFLESGRSLEASICPDVNCPFSDNAASVDITISLLLETIGSYAFPTGRPLKPNVSLDNDKTEEGTCLEEAHCVMTSDMQCCLKNCMAFTTTSNLYKHNSMCHLADLLSLVELLAYKMRWDWTSSMVIPELFKILESCVVDCVSIAVVSLLGQLGRLGVEASGFDCKAVINLRCALLAYLCDHKTVKVNPPLRIAILSALLGLTPVDPETLLTGCLELPTSLSSDAETIRTFVSQLSRDEHELCYDLLKIDTIVGR